MIVIDASTVISSVLEDENSVAATLALEHVADESGVVPWNFWTEIIHALLRAERRGRIDEATADLDLVEIQALPLEADFPDLHATLSAARRYQLTGYDAAYLALAMQLQLPLATVDATLGAAAKAAKCAWKAR